MPFENEHACRLRDPGKYKEFRRGTRKAGNGKEYSIVFGIFTRDGKRVSEEQSYRYNKETWDESEAKKHCKDHKGRFEAAKKDDCFDCEGEMIKTEETDFSEKKIFYADLEVKEDESTEELGIFTGHANTYKIDSIDDIVEPGAFKKTIRETGNERALFYMHNSRDIKSFLGGAVNLKEDNAGLFTRGELLMKYEECRKAFDGIKRKWIDRMSIGLKVVKAKYEEKKGRLIRHILELKLMEVSLCPVGMAANDTALIEDWKNNEGILKFIKDNKSDLNLRYKILSLLGYEPKDLTTLKPGFSTLEPDIETTHEAIDTNINWADVYDLVNLKRR